MRLLSVLFLSVLLSACAQRAGPAAWPAHLPPQSHFLRVYAADIPNQALQTRQQYLEWVLRFYEGSEFMALGWNAIAESVLVDLPAPDHAALSRQLRALGQAISGEWAKDNQVRRIDTAMLSLWGGVMQADFTREYRVAAVAMIRQDVAELLSARLSPEHVDEQRYTLALGVSLEP
ncbi:MAG: hypothetical protein RL572_1913 [Pseudomonadota bacterium]|jgi:hypothetical protein